MGFTISYEELDELPATWSRLDFPDALRRESFRVGKVQRADYREDGTFPIVDQGQELIAGYWSEPRDAYDGPLPVIVFGDHTRIFKFVDFPFVCGADGTKVLVPDRNRFDPQFLYFALLTVRLPSRGYNRHFRVLREKVLPEPPLPEQRSIARVLRAVQQARERTDEVIAAARELKRSLLRHLLTYGPVDASEAARIEMQTLPFGDHPAEWASTSLGDVATVRAGHGFPPRFQGRESGEYPFYKVSDMTLPGNERVMTYANNYVDGAVLTAIKAKPMEASAVIFPKVGAAVATNKKRMLGQSAVFDNNIMGVQITRLDLIQPDFLYRWFESVDLRALSNPGPLPSINAQAVKSAELPLPSVQVQEEIALKLLAVDQKIDAEEARRGALGMLFDSLLHDLMTARLRIDGLATEFA
jgi:type I restriction enzyme S subunit